MMQAPPPPMQPHTRGARAPPRSITGGYFPATIEKALATAASTRRGGCNVFVSAWVLEHLGLTPQKGAVPVAVEGEVHNPGADGAAASSRSDSVLYRAAEVPMLGEQWRRPKTVCRSHMLPLTPHRQVLGPASALRMLRNTMQTRTEAGVTTSPLWLPVELVVLLHEFKPRIAHERVVTLIGDDYDIEGGCNSGFRELHMVSAADVVLFWPADTDEAADVPIDLEHVVLATKEPVVALGPPLDGEATASVHDGDADANALCIEDKLRLKLVRHCRGLVSEYWCSAAAIPACEKVDRAELLSSVAVHAVRVTLASAFGRIGDNDDSVELYNLDDIQRVRNEIIKQKKPCHINRHHQHVAVPENGDAIGVGGGNKSIRGAGARRVAITIEIDRVFCTSLTHNSVVLAAPTLGVSVDLIKLGASLVGFRNV